VARTPLQPSRPVEILRRRIEYWRRTRTKRSPMPKRLWSAAIALARTGGVYPTANALGLKYESLKCRVATASAAAKEAESPSSRPAFFQLGPVAALPPSGGSVVELCDGDAKLTIRLPDAAVPDVLGFATLWLERRG
jgi:hypothetical protein